VRQRDAVGIAILANLIGGSSYVLAKIALEGLTETSLVVVRTVVALGVLAPLAGARLRALFTAGGRDRILLVVMGVVGYALPLVIGNYGLRRSTATNAALLIGTEPLCVVALGALLLGESLGRARLAALALGIVGATLLVANGVPWLTMPASATRAGDLLLVAHGAAWAVYSIAGKPLLARHDAVAVSAAGLAIALPCLLPIAAVELARTGVVTARLVPALAAAITLGLVVSALMTVLWNTALGAMDASRLVGFVALQPLAGVVLGALALGEPVGQWALVGGGLVLAGVALLAHEERTDARAREAA